jgi:lipopolysaccharide transport system permease protein
MSTLDTAPQSVLPEKLSLIEITPPTRWWVLPVGDLWAFRELLYFFVWRDIKVRYKQTVIGAAWAVLQPLLTMVMFSLFFGKLARIPSDGLPYPIFYYTALLPWTYFATALQNGTLAIVSNQHVITKVYFPRLTLPISSTLSSLVDFAISFVMVLILLFCYRIHFTLAILWIPAFLLLAIATALGVGLWLCALNAMYRDVRYILPFLIQFWMLASPVVYPASLVAEKWPQWEWLYWLNPMAGVIGGFRWALTGHGALPVKWIWASVAVVVVILATGVGYFQKMETAVVDVV